MIYKKPIRRRPFGMPITPFNPKTGAFLPLGNPNEIRAFSLIEEHASHLLCESPVPVVGEEGNQGVRVIIAKPFILRRDMFDGKTIDGITYTFENDVDEEGDPNEDKGKRTAEDEDENSVIQEISFPYVIDEDVKETIFAFKREVWVTDYDEDGNPIDTKIHCLWEDLNTAGRGWVDVRSGGGFWSVVVSYEAGGDFPDTYTVTPWNFKTGAGEDNVAGVNIPNSNGGIVASTELWVSIDSYGSYVGHPFGLLEPFTP